MVDRQWLISQLPWVFIWRGNQWRNQWSVARSLLTGCSSAENWDWLPINISFQYSILMSKFNIDMNIQYSSEYTKFWLIGIDTAFSFQTISIINQFSILRQTAMIFNINPTPGFNNLFVHLLVSSFDWLIDKQAMMSNARFLTSFWCLAWGCRIWIGSNTGINHRWGQ